MEPVCQYVSQDTDNSTAVWALSQISSAVNDTAHRLFLYKFAKRILNIRHTSSLSLYKLLFATFFAPKDVRKAAEDMATQLLPSDVNRNWGVTSERDRKTLQSSGIWHSADY